MLMHTFFGVVSTEMCFYNEKHIRIERASLEDVIEDEWKWVLDHNGSTTGQIIISRPDAMTMLTVKSCISRGFRNSVHASRVFNLDSKGEVSLTYLESKNERSFRFNAFDSCVHGSMPKHKLGNHDPGHLRNITGYAIGKPCGQSTKPPKLTEFELNYGKKRLRSLFKAIISRMKDGKPYRMAKYMSGKPLICNEWGNEFGFPFLVNMSHGSVLNASKLEAYIQNSSHSYPSFKAWKIIAADSKREAENMEEENRIVVDYGGILATIAQMAICTIAVFHSIRISTNSSYEKIEFLCKSRGIKSVLVRNQADYKKYFRDPKDSLIPSILSVIELISAFSVPILTFRYSDDWYEENVVFRQSGLIVYGHCHPENPERSCDEFATAHWIVARIQKEGIKEIQPSVLYLSAVISFWLILEVYSMSNKREHQLEEQFFRFILKPFRYVVFLAIIIFRADTYEADFLKNRSRIMDEFEIDSSSPECKRRWAWKSFFRFTYFDSGSPESYRRKKLKDYGSMNRKTNITDNEMQSNLPLISIDDICKASEVISADKFGLLNFCQALTIMADDSLKESIQNFQDTWSNDHSNHLFLKHLAVVFHIRGAIIGDIEESKVEVQKVLSVEKLTQQESINNILRKYKVCVNSRNSTDFCSSGYEIVPEIKINPRRKELEINRYAIISSDFCDDLE